MEAMNYVKPELIVVAFVLYFFGVALRQAQAVKNKYIPLTAVTQGILVAGLSNYVNQIIKQIHKPE